MPSSHATPCLDHNATTPLSARASAAYAYGQRLIAQGIMARPRAYARVMAWARTRIAQAVGAHPDEVLLTSGGTEANALVLAAGFLAHPHAHVRFSALEHPSVAHTAVQYAAHHAGTFAVMPADTDGRCTLAENSPGGPCALASLMLASNETGVLQPVEALVARYQHTATWVHTDAVQALGRVPVHFGQLGVDYLTLAGHKVGAGGTIGALLIRRGTHFVPPAWAGITQDAAGVWHAPSSDNLPGACALAAALMDLPHAQAIEQTARVRNAMEAHFHATCGPLQVLGANVPRLPNTCAIRFVGCRAESLMVALDVQGIAVSQGAACSSGATTVSPGIAALGLSQGAAREVLRISLPMHAQPHDTAALCAALPPLVAAMRRH